MARITSKPRVGKSKAAPASCANRDERYAAGKALRDRVPREEHGEWKPPVTRHECRQEGVDQLPGIANASALASRLSAHATALASVGAMGGSGQYRDSHSGHPAEKLK